MFFRSMRHVRLSGGPRERFLRLAALGAVIAGVIWLYQRHFDRALTEIEGRSTVWDQTGALTPGDKEYVREVARDLKERFGLELRVWLRKEPFELPRLNDKTIFLGVDVRDNQARAVFPPLVARALGPDLPAFLGREHYTEFFKSGDYAAGLLAAVGLVHQTLLDAGSASQTDGEDHDS